MDIGTDPKVKDERVIGAQRLIYELAQYTTIDLFALDCASIWDNYILTFSNYISPRDFKPRFTLYSRIPSYRRGYFHNIWRLSVARIYTVNMTLRYLERDN
jgi:hypothetical protein